METKQEGLEPVLPTAVMPVNEDPKISEDLSTVKPEVSYDFNFENQTLTLTFLPEIQQRYQLLEQYQGGWAVEQLWLFWFAK